jgi:ElaB/YqjD/DUF883 family membrane-anchored ribosome-binding protein
MAASTKPSAKAASNQAAGGTLRDAQASAEESLLGALRLGSAAAQDARAAIRERPYTAIAVAGPVGFLYAVIRR